MEKQGCVYLVGAGCGGPELLTLRGASLLGTCDTVVYDDLIAGGILSLVPDQAEKLYMGKRCGKHSASQEEICSLLIAKARMGKRVVRLKGGDPFVFGRGGEEILALRKAGIAYEEVPGVSSAIAIPAMAGIPVTHRGVSRSVHIVTAHTADTPDGLPSYLEELAHLPGTLVFLMGLNRLEQIAKRLIGGGMPADTPAAVISGGNAPEPAAVRGTLADIVRRTQEAGVQAPAVIVVGAAAAMNLSFEAEKPLRGVCVGLTGTQAILQKLRSALEEHGARVFDAVQSQICPLPLDFDLRTLCEGRNWIVFTSGNGVHLFFQHLARQKIDLRGLHGCRFAAIGRATSQQLWEHGIQADICPDPYTSEALARALCRAAEPGEDIFLFRSRRGSRELLQTLAARYTVRDVPLYDLRADRAAADMARSCLERADYLTFSSASGVELFLREYGEIPQRAACVCIGEVTANALRKVYHKPFFTAPEISAEGIVRVILEAHRQAASNP